MIKKILILALTISSITSICYGQSNEKISALTELATPANDDVIPITDTSANTTKKIRVDTLLGALGGGGDLGADLSSTGDNIFSTTGSVTFDGMVLYADSFVSTGGTMSIVDDFTVLNTFFMPSVQDCSSLLTNGGVCIDSNISGMVDSMAFMGEDGNERVNINMLKSDIVSIDDGDSLFFDDASNGWITLPANIPYWGGTEGTAIYPLTPATTDMYFGDSVSATADTWIKATGEMIINQNNANVHFNVQGDTGEYMIYTTGDQVMLGTNTPATLATLTVSGTVAIEGTGVGFVSMGTGTSIASADPCTSAGTGVVPNSSFFMKTGGVPCYCDSSGVDKKVVDDSACF